MLARLTSVVLLTALLAACAPAQAPATGAPAQPAARRSANQSLKIAQLGMPATLSPESSNSYIAVYWSMYDPPMTLNEKLEVVPWAAERWSQVNPTTWRITLRRDLVFSNGDKLTADDLEFTGKLMLETRTPQITQFGNLTEVKKVDEYSVDFVTKIPDASILPAMGFLWIMPKAYYNAVGKNGFAAKPVGSGPYELVDFRSADIAVFRKRTAEHAFRRPQPAELIFRSITEQTQMIAGLKTGELDVLIGQISPDRIETLTQQEAVVLSKLAAVTSAVFSQTENQARNTPLTDRRVRLALNYAVDKETIAKTIYRGWAKPTGQLSVPDSPSWDPTVQPFPYDPALAKRLLAEAGYPNGFKLPVGIEFTALTGNIQMITAVQGYLRDVGVDAPVTEYELGQFLDKFYGRAGQTKGDIFVTGTGDGNGFATTIYGYYTCNKPLVWWCNPDFDRFMEQAVGEPDIQKRGALLRRAIATLRDDVGLLFLFLTPTFIIHRPTIQGWTWGGSDWGSTGFYNFDRAYRVE
ncbi:MAG: ABC transporter substrate-binding protein [Dehalococcoidia bacterium]|nr:MAG: ABC transporter substrate-binding protein [Dehalococcoidia bacterium]